MFSHTSDTRNLFFTFFFLRNFIFKKPAPHLKMFCDGHHLPGAVGVLQPALVGEAPQFAEGPHQLVQQGLRHSRPVRLQERHFGGGGRVVDSVTSKQIPCVVSSNINNCQGLLYHRTCKRDFLCSLPSLNSYLK